ncbi:MAG TPA: hypothetical protein VMB48_08705 [Steroidobacteraceae bacterium]|nr:hypothetical protein [Steroidobacteraceae bacterium]
MKRRRARVLVACAALLPLPALAGTITYEFTVTGDAANPPSAGPLTATGTVSFDSAELGTPGTQTGPDLITGLSFDWDGQTYTTADAGTGTLFTQSSGQFGYLVFGSDCSADPSCNDSSSFKSSPNWAVTFGPALGTGGLFLYSNGVPNDDYTGQVQYQLLPTPIPGAAWLMLSALVGLGALAYRPRQAR